jgi:hypothetical protein
MNSILMGVHRRGTGTIGSVTAPTHPHLQERYGAARPGRRRLVRAGAAVVVVAFLGWLAWAAWAQSTPPVDSEFQGFAVVDDQTTKAFVDVALGEGVTARCVVRALADDHSIVGELAFEPVDGRNDVVVRTERRATSVALVGCTAPGQNRPR